MSNTNSRRMRRLGTKAVMACSLALMAMAPSAVAQVPVTGIEPVDTVLGSVNGGVQKPHDYICDENRPEVQAIVKGVQNSLANVYPDITTLAARGYAPYADAPLFGLSGRQGHWLNPNFIGDVYPPGNPKAGQPRIMDPEHPESVLVDRWNRPIGVMFIADDPYVPGPAMYKDEKTGVDCNGWHYHTETMADAYWYAYKYLYSGDLERGDVMPPDRTPDLMHVWRWGASGADFKYQFSHNTPPDGVLADPSSASDVKAMIGGFRVPLIPPAK
jgi:hypothetical protein